MEVDGEQVRKGVLAPLPPVALAGPKSLPSSSSLSLPRTHTSFPLPSIACFPARALPAGSYREHVRRHVNVLGLIKGLLGDSDQGDSDRRTRSDSDRRVDEQGMHKLLAV